MCGRTSLFGALGAPPLCLCILLPAERKLLHFCCRKLGRLLVAPPSTERWTYVAGTSAACEYTFPHDKNSLYAALW